MQHALGSYFNNQLVLFLSGMRNDDMAVALSDYTRNLRFADALFQTGAPAMLGSLEQLELYAKGSKWALSGKSGELLEAALPGFKRQRAAMEVAKSHVIVGTFAELKAVASAANLAGKTLITSAVDDERLAFPRAWAPSPRWWAMPASRWRGARASPSPPATATRPPSQVRVAAGSGARAGQRAAAPTPTRRGRRAGGPLHRALVNRLPAPSAGQTARTGASGVLWRHARMADCGLCPRPPCRLPNA